MNRESYEQLIASAKAKATETMGHNPSPQRIEHALDIFAKAVAGVTRDYHLTNLTTADMLAEQRGTSVRSVRALAARRHERFGIGRQIGGTWLFDIDELEQLQPDETRKPKRWR